MQLICHGQTGRRRNRVWGSTDTASTRELHSDVVGHHIVFHQTVLAWYINHILKETADHAHYCLLPERPICRPYIIILRRFDVSDLVRQSDTV